MYRQFPVDVAFIAHRIRKEGDKTGFQQQFLMRNRHAGTVTTESHTYPKRHSRNAGIASNAKAEDKTVFIECLVNLITFRQQHYPL